MINFHPSVCYQTGSFHIHYNIVLTRETILSDIQSLRELSGRVGGQTAGQVVEAILGLIGLGFDVSSYGVSRVHKEVLPIYQVCHKGEEGSPSVDWGTWLFLPTPIIESRPPASALVAHISHK